MLTRHMNGQSDSEHAGDPSKLETGGVDFAAVRSGLLKAIAGKSISGCTVIGLAARSSGEGVTTVARGLAAAFAASRAGPVLLIDSFVANGAEAPADAFPVCDHAAPAAEVEKHIARDEHSGVHRLVIALNADAGADAGERLRNLIDAVRSRYAYIFVDAGSLEKNAYGHWRPNVDFFALVIDGAGTRREVLEDLKREIETLSMKFDGFVFNRRRYPIPKFIYKLIS